MFLFIFQRKRQAYESNLICHGLQLEATRSVSVSSCGSLCEPLCLGACAPWSWDVAWETCSHSHTAGRVGRETEPIPRAREMVRQAKKGIRHRSLMAQVQSQDYGTGGERRLLRVSLRLPHVTNSCTVCMSFSQRGSFQFYNLQFRLLDRRTLAESVMLFHQWPYTIIDRYKTDEAANIQV